MNFERFIPIATGGVLVLLGISFAFKFVRASVMGRLDYWSGFLPISIISPIFVHTTAPPPINTLTKPKLSTEPPPKKTLIKEASGLWVHLVIGPLFLVLSVLLLSAGFDQMGLPGTDTLNFILNGGDTAAPLAVTYDKKYTFQFPCLVRAMKRFGRRMNSAQIPLPSNQRLVDSPEIRAEETNREREAERKD